MTRKTRMARRLFWLPLLLSLLLLFAACPAPTPAVSENPASDFVYTVTDEGTVEINRYIGTDTTVIIPEKIEGKPVTTLFGERSAAYPNAIDRGAFEGTSVQTVVLPASLKSIGTRAFRDCAALTSATLKVNASLKTVAASAFENCTALEVLSFSDTELTRVEARAFYGCTALKQIHLPAGVTAIGDEAFYGCSALGDLFLPESLVTLGRMAVAECPSLETVTIPKDLDLLAQDAARLYGLPALERLIFSAGREALTGYKFFSLSEGVEITVPESVERFSPETFVFDGNVRLVFLGDAPELVGSADFSGTPTIYYDPTGEGWDTCEWAAKYLPEAER